MVPASGSFLGLDGLHVLVTGAAGGIGGRVVEGFLDQGCNVTAHDLHAFQLPQPNPDRYSRLNILDGDISDEQSIQSSFAQASKRFGPVNILIANAGITVTDEGKNDCPIWDMHVDTWEKTYQVNVRGTFLAIKHFLRAARASQQTLGKELDNLAIVVTGEFGEEAHGKAGLQYGLIQSVKNEIIRLNGNARINAVAQGLIDGLDNPPEAQATVPLRKTAKPEDVARAVAFLASHRAAGHISGQCLSVDGGMEGRLIWTNETATTVDKTTRAESSSMQIPRSITKRNKVRIAISIDLDAVSGWLGTGYSPDNVLADYSSGFFAARVGVPRLLRLLQKLNLANRCTWFIPGHSAESFPEEVRQVVNSGCEIGLHGYAHEGAYSLTVQQERDILTRCVEIATKLTGKKPVGYRAPLYQVRESTLDLLEEFGFEYDASLTDHDCHPFFAPRRPPLKPIDYSLPASSWMHPIPQPSPGEPEPDRRPLVCIPCNYYMEDMTPLQFLPHAPNSHGYTDVRVIENLWRDRFLWIRENEDEPVFPVLMHPDTSGMAHVIGMMERLLGWLKGFEGEVEFLQSGELARWWRERELSK